MVDFLFLLCLSNRCVNILRIFPKEVSRLSEQGFAWKLLYFTLLESNNLPEMTVKEIIQVMRISFLSFIRLVYELVFLVQMN